MSITSSLALVPYTPIYSCGMLPDTDIPSSAYEEITRRLPQNELEEIERKIRCLSPSDQQHFIELANIGDLSAIIRIKDYPLHALYAVKLGKITQEDFATINLVYASPDPNKTSIPLFNTDGKVNPKARELIRQTLFLQDSLKSHGKLLTSLEFDSFFEEMAKLPPLQRHFFLEEARPPSEFGPYTIPGLGISTYMDVPTVRTAIEAQYVGLNIFSKCTDNDEPKFMIPSAGMMQTFLNVKFKNHAVRMNFVLGLSSIEDIKNNGLTASRDAALSFPGIVLPATADTLPAKWTDFLYHDFFHAIVVSGASPTAREKMISLANSIKHIATPALYNFIIDLEMSGHYRLNVLFKEEIPEYIKLFMDLDMRLIAGGLVDPQLQNSSYKDRIYYNLAKALNEELPQLKEYLQKGVSINEKQVASYLNKKHQTSKAIEEINEEISTNELGHSIDRENLQLPLDSFKDIMSRYNFTSATMQELEDYKHKLEEEIESEEEVNVSKHTILKSVKNELEMRLKILEATVNLLNAVSMQSHLAPLAKIVHVLEHNCFSEPAPGLEICVDNTTIPKINRQMPRYTSLSRPNTMSTPVTILAGVIALILLRVLCVKVNKSKK